MTECIHELETSTCSLCRPGGSRVRIDHLPDVTTCRSCEAEIRWAVTEKGRNMPIDAEPSVDGRFIFDADRGPDQVRLLSQREASGYTGPMYGSHFATCPDGPAWRRNR